MRRTSAFVFFIVAMVVVTPWLLGAESPPAADIRVSRLVRQVDSRQMAGTIAALAGIKTRHTLSSMDQSANGIGTAERWVKQRLDSIAATSGGRLQVREDHFTAPAGARVPHSLTLTNLVAALRSDPGRVLIVSGHLDSRVSDVMDATQPAPGADDDALGVAVVLELARLMAPLRFHATIVFLVVTGEEQGLLGSTYEAAEDRRAGLGVEAMFTNDIVGNSHGMNGIHDPSHVRVFSEGVSPSETLAHARRRVVTGADNDSASRELARAIASAQARYLPHFGVKLINRRDRYLRGGDHIPFNDAGYAAVRFTEMNEDWRHQHQNVRVEHGIQYGDLPQFVDSGYAANVARVNLAALADMAWSPAPPRHLRLSTAQLESSTTLVWDASTDRDRLGYEVLYRATTAPDWQRSQYVGDADRVTVPLSKDDYLFAVRSISRAGNRSLPVPP